MTLGRSALGANAIVRCIAVLRIERNKGNKNNRDTCGDDFGDQGKEVRRYGGELDLAGD